MFICQISRVWPTTWRKRWRAATWVHSRNRAELINPPRSIRQNRRRAEQFDEHGNRAVADYIQRAADGLERFSDAVRHRDVSSLMGDAEDFARRQPAVFIGAGVAVGFMLARFLRSSSERREAERYGYQGGGDYARGSAAESSYGRHAYQEGVTGSPDTTWSQSGASGSSSSSAGESEGSSRPGGPVSGGSAGGASTSSSPSSTGRKERRNAADT